MFCRYCGKKVLEDSMFCMYCGKKLLVEPQAEPQTESQKEISESAFTPAPETRKPEIASELAPEIHKPEIASEATPEIRTPEIATEPITGAQTPKVANATITKATSASAPEATSQTTSEFQSDPEFVWDLHEFPASKKTEDIAFEWQKALKNTQELKQKELADAAAKVEAKIKSLDQIEEQSEQAPSGQTLETLPELAFQEAKFKEFLEKLELKPSFLEEFNREPRKTEPEPKPEPEVAKLEPKIEKSESDIIVIPEAKEAKSEPELTFESEPELEATPVKLEPEPKTTFEPEATIAVPEVEAEVEAFETIGIFETKPEPEFNVTLDDIKEELDIARAETSYDEKIDKFYTFNQKNEEFQKLLDREYERTRSKESDLEAEKQPEPTSEIKAEDPAEFKAEELVAEAEELQAELDEIQAKMNAFAMVSGFRTKMESEAETASEPEHAVVPEVDLVPAPAAEPAPALETELASEPALALGTDFASAPALALETDLASEPALALETEPEPKAEPRLAPEFQPTNLIFDNDTLARRFDTKEFNADLIEFALEKAGIKIEKYDGFEVGEFEPTEPTETKFEKPEFIEKYESDFKPKFITESETAQETAQETARAIEQEQKIEITQDEDTLEIEQDQTDVNQDAEEDEVILPDPQKQQAFKELEQLWGTDAKETKNDDFFRREGDEDDDDELETKKGKASTIVIATLVILLAIQSSILGVIHFAPESRAAEFVNRELGFAINWFANITGNGQGSNDEGAFDARPEEDKERLIASQLHHNANIYNIQANEGLGLNPNRTYGDNRISNSLPIQNNIMNIDLENDEVRLFDQEIVATIINFNSRWISFVNAGDPRILELVAPGSQVEQSLLSFTGFGETIHTFVELQIGEIRQYQGSFFVWTHEITSAEAEGQELVRRERNRIYELEVRDDNMYIVRYFTEL